MFRNQDTQLITLLQQGDIDTYTKLFKETQRHLHEEALYWCQHMQEAEDAVQEVFTDLWKRREELNDDTNIYGYLVKAVRLQCFGKLRKHRTSTQYRKSIKDAYQGMEPHIPASLALESRELSQQLHDAINAVTAKASRKAFEMSYIEGLPHKVIALEMGISPQVVKNQISRALKVIRAALKKSY